MNKSGLLSKSVLLLTITLLALSLYAAYRNYNRRTPTDPVMQAYLTGNLSRVLQLRQDASDKSTIYLACNSARLLARSDLSAIFLEKLRTDPSAINLYQLSVALDKIQQGKIEQTAAELVETLQQAGAHSDEAFSAVIKGLFARQELSEAEQLLDQWKSKSGPSGQHSYLLASLRLLQQQRTSAEEILLESVELYPNHELSWLALVGLYTRPPHIRFESALWLLQQMQQRFPENETVSLQIAQVSRRLGRAAGETSNADSPPAHLLENAQALFDAGDYANAVATVSTTGLMLDQAANLADTSFQLNLEGRSDQAVTLTERLHWLATATALTGESLSARRAFKISEQRTSRLRRAQDLQLQVAFDKAKQTEIDRMVDLTNLNSTSEWPAVNSPGSQYQSMRQLPGWQAYIDHCSHCHGQTGQGNGPSAANLQIAARNFCDEPIRFVSSEGLLGSDSDLRRSIAQGIPGSSMTGSANSLSELQIDQLVDIVRQFQLIGWQGSRLERGLESEGSAAFSTERLREPVSTPQFAATLPSTVPTVGAELLKRYGCFNCHPAYAPSTRTSSEVVDKFAGQDSMSDGKAAGAMEFFDSLGRPLAVPNLSTSKFRGGDSPRDIYLRLRLGIPGTPHPANPSASDQELIDLVYYVLWLRNVNQP
jgi:cytochrome c553